uniref:Uncharacterized protein n=1 Tax=Rhizophora mucronata TaxID=61149 RepID=A0A2P2IQ79_RHIMU
MPGAKRLQHIGGDRKRTGANEGPKGSKADVLSKS